MIIRSGHEDDMAIQTKVCFIIFWGGFLVFRVFLELFRLFVFLITSWTVIDNKHDIC